MKNAAAAGGVSTARRIIRLLAWQHLMQCIVAHRIMQLMASYGGGWRGWLYFNGLHVAYHTGG
jgi:hypothetical protein